MQEKFPVQPMHVGGNQVDEEHIEAGPAEGSEVAESQTGGSMFSNSQCLLGQLDAADELLQGLAAMILPTSGGFEQVFDMATRIADSYLCGSKAA